MKKIEKKCSCYVSVPNEYGYTIPYFCNSEREAEKGRNFYLSGVCAREAYAAYQVGKCLVEEGF